LVAPYFPVAAAMFLIQLDFFSLTLALPMIADDFDSTATDLQWLLSGYMIALGALLIPAARSGDIVGRRTVLRLGVLLFGVTSLACGLAPTSSFLIAARVLQGVGAAMLMPTAIAVVTNSTGDAERPRIIGALLGIAGVGTALGPVVGGLLASSIGWRWVFLINVPVAAYALWACRSLPNTRDTGTSRSLAIVDWWGVIAVVAGLALVSVAIDDVAVEGWLSAATLVPLLTGITALVAFAIIETRVERPLVQPNLLRYRVFVVLAAAGTMANIGACVYVVSATLELQNIRGYSAAQSGVLFFLSSVGLASCGPLSAKLSARFPASMVMGVALLLSAPALVWLAVAGPTWVYVLALAACGVSTGMGYALGQLAIQNVLPPARSAEGTSVLLTMLISIGGIGVVAATAVMEAIGDGVATSESISAVLIGLAVLLLLAGVITTVTARTGAVVGSPPK
jgi:MFS family permease